MSRIRVPIADESHRARIAAKLGEASPTARSGRAPESRVPRSAPREAPESHAVVPPRDAPLPDLAALDALLGTRSPPGLSAVRQEVTEAEWQPRFLRYPRAEPASAAPWRRRVRGLGWTAFVVCGAFVGILALQAQLRAPRPPAVEGGPPTKGSAAVVAGGGRPEPPGTAPRASGQSPPIRLPGQQRPETADQGLGGPRALLREGRMEAAAGAFASSLMRQAEPFSIQILIACSEATIERAVQTVDSDELYILPVRYEGRACYRIGWGSYKTEAEARLATRTIPSHFSEGGARPRVVPTATIVP